MLPLGKMVVGLGSFKVARNDKLRHAYMNSCCTSEIDTAFTAFVQWQCPRCSPGHLTRLSPFGGKVLWGAQGNTWGTATARMQWGQC